MKGVPLLSAGKLEANNDVNARLDYRGLGLDLRSERPTAKQIAAGVARVLGDPRYTENVARVKVELGSYRPFEIIERVLLHDERALATAASNERDPSAFPKTAPLAQALEVPQPHAKA